LGDLVSVIIPFAPYHRDHVEVARASVLIQTVPAEVIAIEDQWGHVAHARNQGARQASGSLLVFLDADDLLQHDFIEQVLRAWEPGRYVFTDYFLDNVPTPSYDDIGCDGVVNLVTTLISRQMFDYVGGFRPVPLEDTEFYLRALSMGVCGIRVPRPLVHYRQSEGERSGEAKNNPNYHKHIAKYAKENPIMGCGCGKGLKVNQGPSNEQQAGFILAIDTRGGKRQLVGKSTGINYGRSGNGREIWVHPDDVAAMDNLRPAMPEPPPEVINMEDAKAELLRRVRA